MNAAKFSLAVLLAVCSWSLAGFPSEKPKLTLDEFFNAVDFQSVKLSPDGKSVVIGTERADWDQSIFRHDLWLYRDNLQGGSLVQLTESGHDTDPQWSPDGRWIAFVSDRKSANSSADSEDSGSSDPKDKEGTNQLYLISAEGGEAFPLTRGEEEVHAFAWTSDGKALYYATQTPWTKQQKDAYKKQWKDTRQYRESERPDVIFRIELAEALARRASAPAKSHDSDDASDITPGARKVGDAPWRVKELVTSPDGRTLAFVTTSLSQRQEDVEQFEIYDIELADASSKPRRLTNNHAVEQHLRWAADNRHIFFDVEVGDTTGAYRDLQPHLYWVDSRSGKTEQWSQDFIGSVEHYAESANGVMVAARQGTEVSVYTAGKPPRRAVESENMAGYIWHFVVGSELAANCLCVFGTGPPDGSLSFGQR